MARSISQAFACTGNLACIRFTAWLLFGMCASLDATHLFAQTLPANLANARAEEFTLAAVTVLHNATSNARPAFSRDESRLAFLHNTGPYSPSKIVIVSLPEARATKTIDFAGHFPEQIGGIAWSPDGKRVFAAAFHNRNGHDAFVVDVDASTITRLGKIQARSVADIVWPDPQNVYLFAQDYVEFSVRLSLETLSATRIGDRQTALTTAAQVRRTPIDHPTVTLGTTSVGCASCIVRGTAIAAFNRDGSYTRVVFSEGFQSATFSRNAAYAVVEIYPGQLRLLTMRARARPRLALEAKVTPMPNAVQESDLSGIRARIARGEAVFAEVFRPRVNPLNQRVVGPEGAAKGLVRVTQLGDDDGLEARFVHEVNGYPASGDILQTFWTPGPNQAEFRSVSAVVGNLTDVAASPILTGNAERFATTDPTKTVLDAFDAYIAGNPAAVTAFMSEKGLRNSDTFCSGVAANCLRSNYSRRGRLVDRSTEMISRDTVRARVRLRTNWESPNTTSARGPQCQTYDLSLVEVGWRIDSFDGPSPCR